MYFNLLLQHIMKKLLFALRIFPDLALVSTAIAARDQVLADAT
jgi:hypothetical protein